MTKRLVFAGSIVVAALATTSFILFLGGPHTRRGTGGSPKLTEAQRVSGA